MRNEDNSSAMPSSAVGVGLVTGTDLVAHGDGGFDCVAYGQPERGCPARGRRHLVQWGGRRGVLPGVGRPLEPVLARGLAGVVGVVPLDDRVPGAME